MISENFSLGASRNFGFIRFIIFFCAFNYFFYHKGFFNKILIIWALSLSVIVIDSYIESFTGTNILGYDGKAFGKRIVSFFKDEPIVGGYINTFFLIICGYFFSLISKNFIIYKYFILAITLFFLVAIILTGERSSVIKAILGFLIFYFINDQFKIKEKLISILLLFILMVSLINNSDFLKYRYKDAFLKPLIAKVKQSTIKKEFKVEHPLKEFRLEHPLEEIDPADTGSFAGTYLNLYKSAYTIFKDNLFFGVGNKNYRYVTCAENAKPEYKCSMHPHQIYFEFLAEHGLIGTIILLFVLFKLAFGKIKIILQSKNYVQIGCFLYFVTFFIPFLPSGVFFGDLSLTFFFLNLSLMYSINKKTNIFSKN